MAHPAPLNPPLSGFNYVTLAATQRQQLMTHMEWALKPKFHLYDLLWICWELVVAVPYTTDGN